MEEILGSWGTKRKWGKLRRGGKFCGEHEEKKNWNEMRAVKRFGKEEYKDGGGRIEKEAEGEAANEEERRI